MTLAGAMSRVGGESQSTSIQARAEGRMVRPSGSVASYRRRSMACCERQNEGTCSREPMMDIHVPDAN